MTFTTFHLLYSREIPRRTVNDIRQHIEYFERTKEGAWLRGINWRGMNFRYADLMRGSGVGGAQTAVKGNTIFLCDLPLESPEAHRETWELYVFYPTIIHELRHYWQMRKWGWLYIVCCLPVVRNFTMEKDAYRMQDQAEKYFNSLDSARCVWKFRERVRTTDGEKTDGSDEKDLKDGKDYEKSEC